MSGFDGKTKNATLQGTYVLSLSYRGRQTTLGVPVLYVEGAPETLLPVKQITNAGKGFSVLFSSKRQGIKIYDHKDRVVYDDRSLVDGSYCINNVYDHSLSSSYSMKAVSLDISDTWAEQAYLANTYTGNKNLHDLWHCRLGHRSFRSSSVRSYMETTFGEKFKSDAKSKAFCEACVSAKAHKIPPPKFSRRLATRPLERVYFDVIGNIPPGIGGYKYILTFVDEFTRYKAIKLLKSREEVYDKVMEYKREAEGHFKNHGFSLGTACNSPRMVAFCSDGAGENTSNKLAEFLDNNSIDHELSIPYEHHQMGLVERFNRTLWEGAEAMRHHAGFSPRYWPEMVKAYTYIENLMPISSQKDPQTHGRTPYALWHNIPASSFNYLSLIKLLSRRIENTVCYVIEILQG